VTEGSIVKTKGFVERTVPKLMSEGRIPGLSVAIVKEGETIYSEGFGARNVKENLPATPDSLYGIGSVTKSFVALAILQLVEKGKLSLGDSVSSYVPLEIGLQDKPVTVHSLLTHSSGIPSLGTSTIALKRGVGMDVWIPWAGVKDFYRHVNGAVDEIAASPGERFFYLNAGYRMLGHIIQEVSGTRFDTYITENILRPLEMERSTLSKAEYLEDPDRMTPYKRDEDGKPVATEFPYPNVDDNPEFSFIAAAGGIISSVKELVNYLTMNINGGTFGGVELLPHELMEMMHKIQIENNRNYYGRVGYGYGWRVTEDFFGAKMVSHGGSILVSTAHVAFLPEKMMGVAMASNIAGFPYAKVIQGIFASLMGKDPMEVVSPIRISKKMDTLTGEYEAYKGLSRVEVVKRGGLLYLVQKGMISDVTVPLIPDDDTLVNDRYYIWNEGVRQPVEFVVTSPEKIDLYVERNRLHKVS
jgi:CubicO group peptidase (beta-lactamase class C family)